MKRFLIIFTLIISSCSLVSCNSDDDDGPVAKDKIIGKWQISQEFLNGIEIPINDCEIQMTIELFENQTYSQKEFKYDDAEEVCNMLPIKNGTWENLGDSTYFISDIGVESLKVSFSGNTMTAAYSETMDNITWEIKVVFTRIT